MQNNLFDDHVRHEFRSILNVLIHFSFSLTELVSVLAILGLQIALTITQTCPFRFGIGFWSFPFLLISPLSIWLVLWRRSSYTCCFAILIHFCSTLFATAIIIVSFLVLIGQSGFICSTSSWNSSYIVLNSLLIGIAGLLKCFSYGEMILLYMLIRNNGQQSSRIFIEEYDERTDPFASDTLNVNVWRSWSVVTSETQSNSDIFFA
jgi:hypothetical protein